MATKFVVLIDKDSNYAHVHKETCYEFKTRDPDATTTEWLIGFATEAEAKQAARQRGKTVPKGIGPCCMAGEVSIEGIQKGD